MFRKFHQQYQERMSQMGALSYLIQELNILPANSVVFLRELVIKIVVTMKRNYSHQVSSFPRLTRLILIQLGYGWTGLIHVYVKAPIFFLGFSGLM